jgi:hypothetical protein
MTNTFAESQRAIAVMILVTPAGFFDLVGLAVSERPLLFIAGVLFSCSGVLLFDLWKQNPH